MVLSKTRSQKIELVNYIVERIRKIKPNVLKFTYKEDTSRIRRENTAENILT